MSRDPMCRLYKLQTRKALLTQRGTRNSGACSGVFRGRATVRCPPFGRTMKIFYRRLFVKRCVFCHFPARIAKFNNVWWSFAFPNFRKMDEFAVSIEHSEAKSVSASGGLRLLPPTKGSAPGPRWGLRPQTPVIGSRSARSPCPPLCQILNTLESCSNMWKFNYPHRHVNAIALHIFLWLQV